ncbi:MAG: TolC family protein [Bdellovibrionales bacterium]|nr:TolC family protein [Bdellovibrionales bacterium]
MKYIVAILILMSGAAASAETTNVLEFDELWRQVRSESPELRAADQERKAAEIRSRRQGRHWYPRLSLEARVYSTNDPAMNFMSILGQRRIGTADFAPSVLNQPGNQIFESGGLRVVLPIYEGGAGTAAADSADRLAESKQVEFEAAELQVYSQAVSSFAGILALQNQEQELTRLLKNVDEVLSRYKVGTRSNPLGYSGLLGLKNLRNRLEGELASNSAKLQTEKGRLQVQASRIGEDWVAKPEAFDAFVKSRLKPAEGSEPSLSVRALELAAQAVDRSGDAERSMFLPRFGVFANGDLYAGSRSVATGFTGGVYLQWDLFDARNFEAMGEASARASAMQGRAESANRQSRIASIGATQNLESLEKNLSLMNDSTKYLEEQTSLTRELFRNGQINALQLVEVLSRRTDLVVARTAAQLAWTEARQALVLNSGARRSYEAR